MSYYPFRPAVAIHVRAQRIFRQLALDTPKKAIFSLLVQDLLRRDPVRVAVEGRPFFFKRDLLTMIYGFDAIRRIQAIMSNIELPQGARVIDVGANNGWFSAAAVDRLNGEGRLVLFEPNTDLHQSIEANLEERGTAHTLLAVALADVNGTATFHLPRRNSQQSSLLRSSLSNNSIIEERSVEVRTLDGVCNELEISQIDLLKVDIQGAEYLFLNGASESLKATQMALFEISFIDGHAMDVYTALRTEFPFSKVVAPVSHGADILFSRSALA